MSDNFNISFGEETIFGADGKSAYQIACEHGFVGTVDEWLTSLKGNTPDITAYATIDGTIGNPSVEVEEAGTIDNPELTFKFSGLKGEKGDTGATPVITAGGSVNQTVGTPSVEISKTGTAKNPHFNFAFSGIKGQQGIKGDTGATPNITANATIDATVGTPSVDVSKSGTNENPVLSFAFHNLKGEKGNDGLDGFKNRLTEKTDILPTDCVPINEADGTAKYTTTKNLLADVNDALGRKNWFNPMVNSVTSGLTFNAYDDGAIINGTSTTAIYKSSADRELELSKGRYLIKGNTYANDNKFIWLFKFPKNGTWDDRVVFKTIKQENQILEISAEDAEQYYYTPMLTCPKDTTFDNEDWKIILYKLENSEGLDTNLGLNYANKELGDRIENCRDKLEFLTNLVDCNELVDNPANKNIMRVQYADHASNAPTNSNYRVLTINQTQSFASQIAIDANSNNKMYIRSKVGGTWSDWEKLVTATELAAKKPTYTNILTTNEIIPTTFTSYECADFSQCDAFLVCAMYYGAISATIEVPRVYFQFTGESNSIILKNPRNDIVYRVAKGADNTHIIVKAETEGTTSEYKVRVYGITY